MTKPELIAKVKSLGYTLQDFAIVGVRSAQDAPDKFDDQVYVVTKDQFHCFQATTNPGVYWLKKSMNPKGTAVLKPGEYLYKLGFHKEYEALVQAAPVTVYRDKDLDNKSEETAVTDTGYFGINIHRANPKTQSTIVDKWSAGCQVIANPNKFKILIDLCKASKQKTFQYILIKDA